MIQLEGNRIPALGSSHHDCSSLDQVVMTRKRDQRQVINHTAGGVSVVVTTVRSISHQMARLDVEFK